MVNFFEFEEKASIGVVRIQDVYLVADLLVTGKRTVVCQPEFSTGRILRIAYKTCPSGLSLLGEITWK